MIDLIYHDENKNRIDEEDRYLKWKSQINMCCVSCGLIMKMATEPWMVAHTFLTGKDEAFPPANCLIGPISGSTKCEEPIK